MPYDPNNPNQDPRQTMSSGGPAPNQPTPPSSIFSQPLPGGNGGITGLNGGTGSNGGITGLGNTGIGFAPGQMHPGDNTDMFGGFRLSTGIDPGDFLRKTSSTGITPPGYPGQTPFDPTYGQPGSADPGLADLSGAPQFPNFEPPGGPGGGVGTLQGLDFTKPGALEQYQAQTAGYFQQPTLSEMFAKDALARGAGADPTNRAEQAFQQFNSSTPADMTPYYDNQRRIAEENIRKTMAARGSYGSSAADDLYNEAYTNLAADQAQKEAQYGLSRGSLLGSLAQGADQSSQGISANQRNWMNALASIAGQGDTAGLNRVTGGANLAAGAQGAQRARGQDAFNNQLAMGDRMSGILGQGYGNIFGTDLGLFNTGVGLNTGTATEGMNQATQAAAQQRQNVSNFNNLLGGNTQYAKSLYDMFNQPQSPSPDIPYYSNPNASSDLSGAWGFKGTP